MKITFRVILIFLLLPLGLSPASEFSGSYFVDSIHGDDHNNGSQEEPWRTLGKAAGQMPSGGVCYVRAGIYRETVIPKNGQSFLAYQDEKPIITGCKKIEDWLLYKGRIYRAKVKQRVLDAYIGNTYMQKARYPNEDGDPLTSSEWERSTNKLVSRQKNIGTVSFSVMKKPPDYWKGGWYSGVHGKNPFMVAEGRIVLSKGSEITCSELGPGWKGVYGQMWGEGRGYITDHINCLDAENEWHWENGWLYIIPPGIGKPSTLEARVRIFGFILDAKTNVTLKGLCFRGASVRITGGSGNLIDDCHFRNVSPWGTHHYTDARNYYWGGTIDGTSGIHISGKNHTIQNCSVVGGWGHGIHLAGGENLTVKNNYISDFGWNGRFVASPVSGYGSGLSITNNTISRSSGPGIFLYQKNPGNGENVNHVKRPYILHNDIRDCGYMLDDSGNAFIYIQNADVPSRDRSLHGEIAYNILVRNNGGQGKHLTGGIYLDNGSDFCTIHHNIIDMQDSVNARTSAIFLNAAGHVQEDIFIYHNVLWGYRGGHMFAGGIIISTNVDKGGRQKNVVIYNNVAEHQPAVRMNDWPYGKTNNGEGVISSDNIGDVPATSFIDVSRTDFRPKPASKGLIDKGRLVTGINDKNSQCPFKGIAPDIGAYEYDGMDWIAGSSVLPTGSEL